MTAATKDALAGGAALGKVDLHQALRERVRPELMPWCKGCQSHHVAPMLWRYATIEAGARLDAERRYRLTKPGRKPAAGEAVRRFVRWYGPARPGGFADWAGVSRPHADRLWGGIEDELAEAGDGWVLRGDVARAGVPAGRRGRALHPAR